VTGRVLVAAEAAILRTTLREILERAGRRTVGGDADGVEAARAFRHLRRDVVALDRAMPDAAGVEAAREIRRVDPQGRIVMCSARGLETLVMESRQDGGRDHAVKPLGPSCAFSSELAALGNGR